MIIRKHCILSSSFYGWIYKLFVIKILITSKHRNEMASTFLSFRLSFHHEADRSSKQKLRQHALAAFGKTFGRNTIAEWIFIFIYGKFMVTKRGSYQFIRFGSGHEKILFGHSVIFFLYSAYYKHKNDNGRLFEGTRKMAVIQHILLATFVIHFKMLKQEFIIFCLVRKRTWVDLCFGGRSGRGRFAQMEWNKHINVMRGPAKTHTKKKKWRQNQQTIIFVCIDADKSTLEPEQMPFIRGKKRKFIVLQMKMLKGLVSRINCGRNSFYVWPFRVRLSVLHTFCNFKRCTILIKHSTHSTQYRSGTLSIERIVYCSTSSYCLPTSKSN